MTTTRYARYAAGQSLTPPLYPIVYALDIIQQHQLEMKSLLYTDSMSFSLYRNGNTSSDLVSIGRQ